MREANDRDTKSAYGSRLSSSSIFTIKKGTFSLQEHTLRESVWYRWTKQKIREARILEVLILTILLFVLVNSYRNHFMIVNFQTQLSSYLKQTIGNDAPKSRNIEKEVLEKTNMKVNEILAEILRENMTSVFLSQGPTKSDVLEPVIPCTDKKPVLTNFDPKRFNAANLIIGAEVDTSMSSNSNLNPFFGFDQSDLVLVDRPNPPADRAWCTYDRDPVLTVILARVVKPIAVSYQHSKWKGPIPTDAPSVYDVVGCRDDDCDELVPLVSSCGYNSYNGQEEFCNIPSNKEFILKVQFHFRKNHGNKERTCVNLVRVYAETDEAPTIKEKYIKPSETCTSLRFSYHNKRGEYDNSDKKSCGLLYAKNCCTECPECCDECWIQDYNREVFGIIFLIVFLSIMMGIPVFFFTLYLCDVCRRRMSV